MKFHLLFMILTLSFQLRITLSAHTGIKLLKCPCNADRLCSTSTTGYAICNCWTQCNYECPFGFDRIDETTEYCPYGDTRNYCSTTIICDHYNKKSQTKLKSNTKKSKHKHKHKHKKESSSTTKNNTSSHNELIETEDDNDDSGYFKLSIVGFVLWQIASIGLGMLVCGCCQDFANWIQ
eukprot:348372_1